MRRDRETRWSSGEMADATARRFNLIRLYELSTYRDDSCQLLRVKVLKHPPPKREFGITYSQNHDLGFMTTWGYQSRTSFNMANACASPTHATRLPNLKTHKLSDELWVPCWVPAGPGTPVVRRASPTQLNQRRMAPGGAQCILWCGWTCLFRVPATGGCRSRERSRGRSSPCCPCR